MASASDHGVGPVTFLVNDACPITVVIKPWRAGLSCETLHSPECGVLRPAPDVLEYLYSQARTLDTYLNGHLKQISVPSRGYS